MERFSTLRSLGFGCLLVLSLLGGANGQEYEGDYEPGVIGSPPPFDLTIEVTTGPNGELMLSRDEFLLAQGGYYRFNFVCPEVAPDADGFHFEAPDLVANSHIRVLSVDQMEFYTQGLSFRAVQCDDAGTARFSFHPMRSGVYEVQVHSIEDPSKEASALVVVE
ncbi:MAG: hypothetical protein WD273_02030 [Trueperaceae bacterium]